MLRKQERVILLRILHVLRKRRISDDVSNAQLMPGTEAITLN
jgi:hypothetical protein